MVIVLYDFSIHSSSLVSHHVVQSSQPDVTRTQSTASSSLVSRHVVQSSQPDVTRTQSTASSSLVSRHVVQSSQSYITRTQCTETRKSSVLQQTTTYSRGKIREVRLSTLMYQLPASFTTHGIWYIYSGLCQSMKVRIHIIRSNLNYPFPFSPC